MVTFKVGLIGQQTGRVFVYDVASPEPTPTDEQLFGAALVEHGRNIVFGRVDEIVHADRAEIERGVAA